LWNFGAKDVVFCGNLTSSEKHESHHLISDGDLEGQMLNENEEVEGRQTWLLR
jgi:hypothetical protein